MRGASKQGRIHGSISRGGWAGAVLCWAGAVGGPVYTTASVTCDWAGAEMQKPLAKQRVTDGPTDGRTDGRTENTSKSVAINLAGAVMQEPLAKCQKTDGRTDTVTHRVA